MNLLTDTKLYLMSLSALRKWQFSAWCADG